MPAITAKANSAAPKSFARWNGRIEKVEDQRHIGNGIWVHLKAGWINDYSSTHMIHEDTVGQCVHQLKEYVVSCFCEDCCSIAKDFDEYQLSFLQRTYQGLKETMQNSRYYDSYRFQRFCAEFESLLERGEQLLNGSTLV